MIHEEINKIVTKYLEPDRCWHEWCDNNWIDECLWCSIRQPVSETEKGTNSNPDFFGPDSWKWFGWAVEKLVKRDVGFLIHHNALVLIDYRLSPDERNVKTEHHNLLTKIPQTFATMLAEWIKEKGE